MSRMIAVIHLRAAIRSRRAIARILGEEIQVSDFQPRAGQIFTFLPTWQIGLLMTAATVSDWSTVARTLRRLWPSETDSTLMWLSHREILLCKLRLPRPMAVQISLPSTT